MRSILFRGCLALALALPFAAAAAAVPTPESHFGHAMGASGRLLDWDKVVSYFQSLAQTSDRIRVRELGKSTEGRPFLAATIAAPETLRDLDRYREIQRRLADPRLTPSEDAPGFIAAGKTVVLITCSIHSTEVASTESAVEFAYRLATSDTPKTRAILANTIVLLVPSLNPDGVDRVTRWYRRTLGTAYEGTSPPELYQKYTGHDNNRDWYIFSQAETRLTVGELQNVWHPQIVYDVHQQGQSASRMFFPPWLDPIDPNVDAALMQETNAIGAGMAADLTAAGRDGVVIHALYDFWSPARQYSAYHAGMRILSESASARLASPIHLTADQIDTRGLGYNPRERSWNYLHPWLGGTWRLEDIVQDQLISMESCLYQAALRREDLLRTFYEIGRRAATRTSPFAFVIPMPARDPGAARQLIETLRFGSVEVGRAQSDFTAEGRSFAAGSFVVPMRQPYSGFAKTLLEVQHYPDQLLYPGGPPQRPYDVTAQTLPLLMGVETVTVNQPFEARLDPGASTSPAQPVELSAVNSDPWSAITQIWKEGKSLWRDPTSGGFALSMRPLRVSEPRIAIYKSWLPAMDEGWTRWVLDRFGFPHSSLTNRDIGAGALRARFDSIVFPDETAVTIAEGYRPGTMPEEFTGGIDAPGIAALDAFVRAGGTLVFLNRSCEWAAAHLALPVTNVTAGLSDREFYSPGSLLNVSLDTRDSLSWGVPTGLAIWNEHSPAWELRGAPSEARVIARYVPSGVLASGWLLGENRIAGKAAIARIDRGAGHIVLFGMRPQYRAQSYLTFKLFFNALLLSTEVVN